MDVRLFHAARLGNIQGLHAILKEDPTALEKVALSLIAETPLHVATLTEQTDFVKEITRLRPSFAWEANTDALIPLHIACATGNIDIVIEFLNLGPELCLVKDKAGRNCLHFAALKGRVGVIREVMSRCPQAAKEATVEGDTALHLAIKHGQFDALKALFEGLGEEAAEVVDAKDGAGQTVSQLAAATKQVQVEKLLDKSTGGETGERQKPGHGNGSVRLTLEEERSTTSQRSQIIEEKPEDGLFRSLSVGLDRMVPVVAGLITSVTFIAVLTPPKAVWKENMKVDWKCMKQMGFSTSTSFEDNPTDTCPSFMFVTFASFNTAGFISAVLIIFLHPSAQVAPLLLSSALIFLAMTYLSLSIAMSPSILAFLITYGGTILAFLCVIFYLAMLRTFLKHFLRRLIIIVRKFRQRSEANQGRQKWKGMFCC